MTRTRPRGRTVVCALAAVAVIVLAGCSAQTNPASSVGSTTATLNGHFTWKSSERGNYWWEYSSNEGATWTQVGGGPWGSASAPCDGSGSTNEIDGTHNLTGLTPNTDYVYRIAGTVCGGGTAYEDSNALGDDPRYEYDFFRTKPASCDRTLSAGGDLGTFVGSLSSGQVACLHGGTYTMSEVDVNTPGITLTSYPGERATVRGTLKLNASDVALTNLNLDDTGGAMPNSPNLFGNNDVLYGNDITSDRICVVVGPNTGPQVTGVKIEANRIHDCGTDSTHHQGIYAEESQGLVVRGNWVYDNAARAIQFYPNADGSDVYGNVFDGNGDSGVNFGALGAEESSNNIVRNNVIAHSTRWNVEENPTYGTGTGNQVNNNCLWVGNSNSYYNQNEGVNVNPNDVSKTGNVDVTAPLFVNRTAKDFRLQSSSPCLSKMADLFTGTAP